MKATNVRDLILAEHSKSQALKIIKWVGKSQARFDELFKLFLANESIVTQRAGWPMSDIAAKYPELMKKHTGKLIRNLRKINLHDAVKRNTTRILQFIPFPVRYHGEVMDFCIRFVQSPTETVAVKAFSLGVLEKLLPLYPEIYNELKLIIEERWEHETPAFHSRAKRIMKIEKRKTKNENKGLS